MACWRRPSTSRPCRPTAGSSTTTSTCRSVSSRCRAVIAKSGARACSAVARLKEGVTPQTRERRIWTSCRPVFATADPEGAEGAIAVLDPGAGDHRRQFADGAAAAARVGRRRAAHRVRERQQPAAWRERSIGRRRSRCGAALGASRWAVLAPAARSKRRCSRAVSVGHRPVARTMGVAGPPVAASAVGADSRHHSARRPSACCSPSSSPSVVALLCGLAPALRDRATGSQHACCRPGGVRTGAARVTRDALVVAEIALVGGIDRRVGPARFRACWRCSRSASDSTARTSSRCSCACRATKYATPESIARFYQQAIARCRAVPGIESAGLVRRVPLQRQLGRHAVHGRGRPVPAGSEPRAGQNIITPE